MGAVRAQAMAEKQRVRHVAESLPAAAPSSSLEGITAAAATTAVGLRASSDAHLHLDGAQCGAFHVRPRRPETQL